MIVATSIVADPETLDLTPAKFAAAKRTLEAQWPAFLALDATAALSREAGEFAERYALRGLDALHLASR